MKKAFATILVLSGLLLATSAHGQYVYDGGYYKLSHPNEISASYGVSLLGSVFSGIADKYNFISWLVEDPEKYVSAKVGGSKGVLNLGYSYQLNKAISVGAAAGYNRISLNLEDKSGRVNAFNANVLFLMTTGKFDWFRTGGDIFGMYSKVGLGAMCIAARVMNEDHLSNNFWSPTLQVSAIGMELGRAVSGYVELGLGMQGIIQFGIKGRF